jgi:hypothetical protein
MSNRVTALQLVSLNIGTSGPGSDIKAVLINGQMSITMATADARGMGTGQAIERHVPVKESATGAIEFLRFQSGNEITNLNVTVFSPGGVELGTMRSCAISFEVETEDGSAAATRWTFANRLGQTIRVRGTLTANTSGGNAQRTAIAGVLSGTAVTMTFATGAGNSIGFPARIVSVGTASTRGGITTYDIELISNGGSATVTGYNAFLQGVGAATYFLSMNAGDGSLVQMDCLFTSGEVTVENGAIVTERYEFANRGAVTIT